MTLKISFRSLRCIEISNYTHINWIYYILYWLYNYIYIYFNQSSAHHQPFGAALKPWTNLAEFSLKKRWRYMMRTSAWQQRFKMSIESLISSENPSAANGPSSTSSSREKSFKKTHTYIKSLWTQTKKLYIQLKHNKNWAKQKKRCLKRQNKKINRWIHTDLKEF